MTKTSTLHPPAKEVIWLLQRGLNTMEPEKIPKWALSLADGIRESDIVTIKLEREDEVPTVPAG